MMIDNFVGLGNNHSLLENGCWGSVNQLCIFQQRKKLEKKSGNFPKLLWLCSVFVFCEKLAKLFANSFSFKNVHLPWKKKKVFQTLFCFKCNTFFSVGPRKKNGDRHSENCQRLFRWQFRYQTIVQLLAARPLGALVVYDSALIKKSSLACSLRCCKQHYRKNTIKFCKNLCFDLNLCSKSFFRKFYDKSIPEPMKKLCRRFFFFYF